MVKNKVNIPDRIINAVFLILIGILFIAFRSEMLNILLTIIGSLLIVHAIYEFFKRKIIAAIIELCVGIFLIVGGWTILTITLLVLGIIMVLFGIYKLLPAINNIAQKENKVLAIIYPLMLIIVGVLLIVSMFAVLDALFVILGIILVCNGIILLVDKQQSIVKTN